MQSHSLSFHQTRHCPAARIAANETATGNNNVEAKTGLPALVAPMGLTKEGLPIGLELMGKPFSEPKLIAMGYAYEQASPPHIAPTLVPALPGEHIGGKPRVTSNR
jgi:amidase